MFCVGHGDGYITFAKQADLVTVRLYFDAVSRDIVAGFKIAQQRGWLSPDNRLLVDLRQFTGSVDWGAIRELRALGPWIDDPAIRNVCAYILEPGDMRRLLINVLAALYPVMRHRSFTEETAALTWLTEAAEAPHLSTEDRHLAFHTG
ncbi:hypothetical protein [Niveispirillum sp. BGYR6]|uniref:hypothetical protein n=1 Tax=Niveispirillum sp. BGYR6 TaxID=2971249 RepID=UPI0022B98723|nr:hypothetical protein [Niveispirillum sp. BGYR6]MDG5494480.1 hypothetical protein [Niveispirillum sp. BGYR6]